MTATTFKQSQLRTKREILAANRTYYVRTDGSDSNTGLTDSSGGAFLTIQKAINVTSALDMSIYDVTIQVRSGTFAEQLILKQCLGSGTVYLLGDTATPANVVISGSTAFSADSIQTIYNIQGFRGTGAGSFILSQNGSLVDFGLCTISNTGQQLRSADGGAIRCVGNYTISASATAHLVSVGGVIRIQSKTITLTGTPAFSAAFCDIGYVCEVIVNGNTFTGSATGVRYSVGLNGVCYVAGAGANYFPGNSAGGTTSGGQYV